MAVHSQMFSPNVFLIYALTIPEVVNFFLEGVGGGGGKFTAWVCIKTTCIETN